MEDKRLEYLIGQVAALESFCMASIITNPDRMKLITYYQKLAERGSANNIYLPISDTALNAYDKTVEKLVSVLQRMDQYQA
jgi:hypothetical protein